MKHYLKILLILLLSPLFAQAQINPDLQPEIDSVYDQLNLYTMINGVIRVIGIDSLRNYINSNTSAASQTLSLSSPILTISNGNSVDLSVLDTELTQEEVEDFAATLITSGNDTLIQILYNDIQGSLSFIVEDSLSKYTNDAGFITAESQSLTLTNSNLSISGGNSVDLSSLSASGSTSLEFKYKYVPVFILDGQSNAGGNGLNADVADPTDTLVQNHMHMWKTTSAAFEPYGPNNRSTIQAFGSVNPAGEHGVELFWAKYWQSYYPNDTLYVIKNWSDGTALFEFQEGRSYRTNYTNQIDSAITWFQNNDKIPVFYLFWHQGESDANSPDEYGKELRKLFNYYKSLLGQGLKIQAIEITNPSTQDGINDHFRQLALDDPSFHLVKSKDFPRYDGSHFRPLGFDSIAQANLEIMSKHLGAVMTIDSFPFPDYVPQKVAYVESDSNNVAIDFLNSRIHDVDMTGLSAPTITFNNAVEGEYYTLRWFNNPSENINFPSNFYNISSDSLAVVSASNATDGIYQFYKSGTNYYLISPQFSSAASSSASVEPEYTIVLEYCTNNSITAPDSAQQVKHNTLIRDLKAAGAWSELDVFSVFKHNGAEDFSYINWIDTTRNLTEVNSLTFASNVGLTGVSGSYVNTNFQGGLGYNFRPTQNDAAMMIGIDAAGSGSFEVGSASSPSVIFDTDISSNYYVRWARSAGENNISNSGLNTGLFLLDQSAAGTGNLYRNGIFLSTFGSSNLDLGGSIYLFTHSSQYSTSTQTFFAAGGSINSIQNTVYTALNTYLSNP